MKPMICTVSFVRVELSRKQKESIAVVHIIDLYHLYGLYDLYGLCVLYDLYAVCGLNDLYVSVWSE